MLEGSEYVSTTLKMSHSFIQNCCWANSTSFTSSRMKDLCRKWKVKLIFRGVYRLSGTGIVEYLEITDVGCGLKQFVGLTRLTVTPRFYDRSTPMIVYTLMLIMSDAVESRVCCQCAVYLSVSPLAFTLSRFN